MNPNIRPVCDKDVGDLVQIALLAWAPVFESFEQTLGSDIYPILYPDWGNSHGIGYYTCTWRGDHFAGVEKRACTEKPFRANAAEKNVWEYVERYFCNLDGFGDDLKAAQQDEFDRQEPKRVELENVEAMLADAERDAEKIARAMKDAEEGVVKRSLQKDEREVNARCDELTKRRDKLQAELGARLLTGKESRGWFSIREMCARG